MLQLLGSCISKSGRFSLKLKVHHLGKFVPKENNPLYSICTIYQQKVTTLNIIVPYMAKLLSGKAFVVEDQNGHSQENFHSAITCIHVHAFAVDFNSV